MRIQRHFTEADQSPYEGIEFVPRDSRITNPNGSPVFEASGVMAPASWSQVAVDIMAQKYFRKTGVPQSATRVEEPGVPESLWRSEPASANAHGGGETDARQAFDRLTGAWTYWGWKHDYFDSEDDAQAFRDELACMLATQRAAPNSPQWFNTGLHWAYGIAGPAQGHSYVDPESGALEQSGSAYERPQPHACFIQSVADDLVGDGGIMDLWTREARIFKYGSGTGSNFSAIRGENEPLSGGGKSSGLMSFLKIGDRAAGAIKSGGTTRRAAKMVIVDADHPDIEAFIDWKANEEQKVASLVAGSRLIRKRLRGVIEAAADGLEQSENRRLRRAVARAHRDGVPDAYVARVLHLAAQDEAVIDFTEYDTDWQGEAYQTVSGQNANNSVRVTADFLAAVREDREWDLIRRTDGSVAKTLPARELWDRVASAAWQSADPGVQYDTPINEWHTAPVGGRIRGSNPCVTGDTLVATADGLVRIDSLVGQRPSVLGLDGELHRAARVIETGSKPAFRLRTQAGFELDLTADHRVWTIEHGDVPASEVEPGDTIQLQGSPFGDVDLDFVSAEELGRALALTSTPAPVPAGTPDEDDGPAPAPVHVQRYANFADPVRRRELAPQALALHQARHGRDAARALQPGRGDHGGRAGDSPGPTLRVASAVAAGPTVAAGLRDQGQAPRGQERPAHPHGVAVEPAALHARDWLHRGAVGAHTRRQARRRDRRSRAAPRDADGRCRVHAVHRRPTGLRPDRAGHGPLRCRRRRRAQLQRVHVPRRHRLQPRLAQPHGVLRRIHPQLRHRGVHARRAAVDRRARDLRADGAVPEPDHRATLA